MSVEIQKFRLFKSEKDSTFNIDSLERYELLLQLGANDMQIGVLDSAANKFLLIEDYILPGVSGLQERLHCYEQIFSDHHLLMANFWKEVKVSFKGRKFSLVPENLYDEKAPQVYLNMNSTFDNLSETLQVYSIASLEVKIVYSVENHILRHLKTSYPIAGFKSIPHSACLIMGFKRYNEGIPGPIHCLYIDRFILHQVVLKNNQITYYNLFQINKFDDYFRYISMVAEDQKIDMKKDKYLLWGFLGAKSSHLAEIKKRLPQIELGLRPRGLYFGYAFDEIPEHQYFDLLSLNLL